MATQQIRNIIAGGERVPRDLFFQAAGNTLDRVLTVHRHGIMPELDNSHGWRTLWDIDGDYPRVLTAGQISVVSTDNEDSPQGSGASKIIISGCDGSGDPIFEVVTMGGTFKEYTDQNFFWVDFAKVIESNSPYGGAVGTITLSHLGNLVGGDQPVVAQILPEINRTCQAVAVIPNHYSGYILDHVIAVEQNEQVRYGWRVSSWPVDGMSVRMIAFPNRGGPGGPWNFWSRAPERIHFPSLVEMVVLGLTGNNIECSGAFTLMAIHDDYDFSIPSDLLIQTDAQIEEWIKKYPGIADLLGSWGREPE